MRCPTILLGRESGLYNYVAYTTMLVERDITIDYHVIIFARNGTIPDKTSCWLTGFIKSADYLFLTGFASGKGLVSTSYDDLIIQGNV